MRASLLTSLPCMMAEPTAFSWLCLQESLLKAPNTVEAYARGVNDWLRFCHQNDVSPTEASREILALYVLPLFYGSRIVCSLVIWGVTSR